MSGWVLCGVQPTRGLGHLRDFLFSSGASCWEDWGMELHLLNDIHGQATDSRSARWMTSEQLLDLGMNQVVYLKSGLCDGKMVFVLFDADGTPAIVAYNVTDARETAIDKCIYCVAIHSS